jgi:hypothetical protein
MDKDMGSFADVSVCFYLLREGVADQVIKYPMQGG